MYVFIVLFQKPSGTKQGEASLEDKYNHSNVREDSWLTTVSHYDYNKLYRQHSYDHCSEGSKANVSKASSHRTVQSSLSPNSYCLSSSLCT